MVAQNLTRQPSFFGCDADDGTPLLLYLPNSPWTGYSNFSFEKESFTDHELDLTMDNAFQLVTFGNGTIDEEWPACLACAVIRGSLRRMDIDVPEQCNKCFERHCWDGTVSSTEATANDFDLRPMLNSSLTFDEWNTTIWSATSSADEDFASSLTYGKGLCLAIAMALGTALLNIL
jgi:lysophospholipase